MATDSGITYHGSGSANGSGNKSSSIGGSVGLRVVVTKAPQPTKSGGITYHGSARPIESKQNQSNINSDDSQRTPIAPQPTTGQSKSQSIFASMQKAASTPRAENQWPTSVVPAINGPGDSGLNRRASSREESYFSGTPYSPTGSDYANIVTTGTINRGPSTATELTSGKISTSDISIGQLLTNKKDTINNQRQAIEDITYTNAKILYNKGESDYYNSLAPVAESTYNRLNADTSFTPEQKEQIYSNTMANLNLDLKAHAEQSATKYQTEFSNTINNDMTLKDLDISKGKLIQDAASFGIDYNKDVYGTEYFSTKKTSLSDVGKSALEFAIPTIKLVEPERDIVTTGVPEFGMFSTSKYPSNMVMQTEDITAPLATAAFGIGFGNSLVNKATKEALGERVLTSVRNPSEEFALGAISTKGKIKMTDFTLFNPSKEFTFDIGNKGVKFAATKIGIEKELAINPKFGSEFNIGGGAFSKQTLVSSPISKAGFNSVKKEVFMAKLNPSFEVMTEKSSPFYNYVSDFAESKSKNTRLVVGGMFEKEGVAKEMFFIINPKTQSMRLGELSMDFNKGFGGEMNIFRRVKNTGKEVLPNIYQEGEIFRNVGNFGIKFESKGFKQFDIGSKRWEISDIGGTSYKKGKTSGTFTWGDIQSYPDKGFMPRITTSESPTKYNTFSTRQWSVFNKPITEYGLVPSISRKGTSAFMGKATTKNVPFEFSYLPKTSKGPLNTGFTNIGKFNPGRTSFAPTKQIDSTESISSSELMYGSGYKGAYKESLSSMDSFGKLAFQGLPKNAFGYNKVAQTFAPKVAIRNAPAWSQWLRPSSGFGNPIRTNQKSSFSIKTFQPEFSSLSSKSFQTESNFNLNKIKSNTNQRFDTTQSFSSASKFDTALKFDTAQQFKQISLQGFTPRYPKMPRGGFNWTTDFGGLGFDNFKPELPIGSKKKKKGKKRASSVGPSFTAEVFNIVGKFPKSGRYGISPFQIRNLPRSMPKIKF